MWDPHGYSTSFSLFNHKTPKITRTKTKFKIWLRGPNIWNKFLNKKLNHFRSLNINWNWNCFLLAMELHTSEIFHPWFCNIMLTKRGLMTKKFWISASPFSFQNSIWISLFTIIKYLCSVFVWICNIWKLYEENIGYDLI